MGHPTIDFHKSRQTAVEGRAGWERDFERTHKEFAEVIATTIAQEQLQKFVARLEDPCEKIFGPKDKYVTFIPLDFTERYHNTAETLQRLAGPAANLPPFQRLIEEFLQKKDPANPDARPTKRTTSEEHYFQDLIGLVGRCAAQKLNEHFAAFVAQDSKHADLKFELTWIRKDEQVFSNPSDFTDNSLRIQL